MCPFHPAFLTKLNVQSTNIRQIRNSDIPKLSRFHFTCHLPNDCHQSGGAAQQMYALSPNAVKTRDIFCLRELSPQFPRKQIRIPRKVSILNRDVMSHTFLYIFCCEERVRF